MTSRRLRRFALLAALVTAAAGVLAAPAEVAGAAPSASSNPSAFEPSPLTGGRVVGDITGDGVPDLIVLGRLGPDEYSDTACAVQVRPGGSRTTTTSVLPVPVAPGTTRFSCPDLGTVEVAPGGNRLAVSYFLDPSEGSPSVQLYSLVGDRLFYRFGFEGLFHPSVIATQDFNGDGWGDLWQSTGEGFGFASFLVRGTAVAPLYANGDSGFPDVAFTDLDHGRGTDIVLGLPAGYRSEAQAVVVDGATGVALLLASSDDEYSYRVTAVDLDGDAYPDLRVAGRAFSGAPDTVQFFRNASSPRQLSFVPVTRPSPGS